MIKKLKNLDQKTYQLAGVCVLLFVVMVILRGDRFLRPANIESMLFQLVESGLFSLCIAVAYLSRGIDLSIVTIANMVSIVNGIILRTYALEDGSNTGLLLLVCVVVAILIGAACGLLNGFLIAKVGIFPILATIGTQNVFMGISMILTQGRAEGNFPQPLLDFGTATIFKFGADSMFGFPLLTALFLLLFIVMCIIVHKTPYGRKLQWMGSNKKTAWFTGIDNNRVTYVTFLISGILAALAGLVIMARTNSAKADYGLTYVFQALLICVLAGISPLGGRGKVYNLILSLVALQILSTGFNMLRVSALIRDSLFGFLLVFAILLDYATDKIKNDRLNKQAIAAAKNTPPPDPTESPPAPAE